ncbi:DUF6252 family protein [Flavobacterium sp. NKUCC04_CG]|uniref:DUF6252 family protein n=1 Tax=Flavobacterium sp. NKUCC04_CG TaxID=2842121 RepID=UPI001C5BD969|nr:DUF6252 family protein [Flavobacterium sp. NKUCC04_CG]MBW3519628.1 hypothetical protein [Flavobacterium sp. NKUCC04_CG]
MKNTNLFRILFVAMISIVGFSSCDEESIEPTLLNQELVGESIVRLIYQDTLIIKRDIVAQIDEKGVFSFHIKAKKEDILHLTTMRFEEGLFPSNINMASYYFSSINQLGTSVDTKNPLTNTGWVRITSINTIANVVSGEFKVKIYPPVDPGTTSAVLIKPFEVEGEFRNLRFVKAAGDIFETKIEGNNWVYKNRSVRVENGRVVITTTNTVTEELMELAFDQNLEEGSYNLNNFSARYVSAAGVAYATNVELGGSSLKIDQNSNNKVKGSFYLKMKNASGSQTVNLTDGSFNVAY